MLVFKVNLRNVLIKIVLSLMNIGSLEQKLQISQDNFYLSEFIYPEKKQNLLIGQDSSTALHR